MAVEWPKELDHSIQSSLSFLLELSAVSIGSATRIVNSLAKALPSPADSAFGSTFLSHFHLW
ncbi:hypothetical protein F8388_011511 [Cannabis sativa]|uniref:Uncharacterized protein n=1 Tax=Cannabis sativa TaxID=3483 RepID=A0A7J6G4H0_CANSA|nr:hypothetical protein F8388_011511 [Cannabis sativa]